MTLPAKAGFPERVVDWQRLHGRRGMPWQETQDPYRVWLSEVMLQQTQVETVRRYYDAFVRRFPNVSSLAAASDDEVMALWSGLGYYSRARNLHRCAREVVTRHGGEFPRSAAELERLPGIGRSTAAAIAAFSWSERVPILDGNVKRVLARVIAWEHDVSTVSGTKGLWLAAEERLPMRPADMPAYTQGLMDIGAKICVGRTPLCLLCPLSQHCAAFMAGDPGRYPLRSKRARLAPETWWVVLARRADSAIWLEKRPARGIWGGLWSPPVFLDELVMREFIASLGGREAMRRDDLMHALTHKDLILRGVDFRVPDEAFRGRSGVWFDRLDPRREIGLPAPISKLLAAGQ